MIIQDKTEQVFALHKSRNRKLGERTKADLVGVCIHRLSDKWGEDALEIATAYTSDDPRGPGASVGKKLPYNFAMGKIGHLCQQGLPLTRWGWHAVSHSRPLIAIACLGDFRTYSPSRGQWDAALALAVELCLWIGPQAAVIGHTEMPDATKWGPDHDCPGKCWGMPRFRARVLEEAAKARAAIGEGAEAYAEQHLRRLGVRL